MKLRFDYDSEGPKGGWLLLALALIVGGVLIALSVWPR